MLVVANLFVLPSSGSSNLHKHPDPGQTRERVYLQEVCDEAEKIVVAWGAKGEVKDRAIEFAEILVSKLYVLDTTKDGHPNHPLYQPADAELELWGASELRSG